MTRAALLVLVPVLLAGCARGAGGFPSLAARPGEGRGFEEPAVPAPAPAAADPRLDAQVAAAAGRLSAARRAFDAGASRAQATGARARGAGAGTEAWIAAQAALSDLDAARADTSAIVTEAEQLEIARAASLAAPYPALEGLQADGRAELERQETLIARLAAALAPAT